jgi:hypothetical protein
MRRDEIEASREQKKHLLSEFRSLTTRYRDGQAWNPEDKERGDYLDREIRAINDDLRPFESWEEVEAVADELGLWGRLQSWRSARVFGRNSSSRSICATLTTRPASSTYAALTPEGT